ncbi:MAG: hypothetical protein ACE5MI_04190 [Acidimicrobiia bacterium]
MSDVQDALRAVDGVADATVEEAQGAPIGVRVELENGADEGAVATSVQRVLSSYGLRSRLVPPRSRLEPVVPPPPPKVSEIRPGATEAAEEEADEPAVESAPTTEGVAEITLTQRHDGVLIAISDWSGETVERHVGPRDSAVTAGIVEATAELASPDSPPPGIIMVEYREGAGQEVVTVVLDVGTGEPAAAAETVTAGRELALARATWRALTADS